MWKNLGFSESPYNTSPLEACAEDVQLLVNRESEALQLCNIFESSKQGILALSGVPGVGKTSFINIQQYLLETEKAFCGPKILAARKLCSTQPDDTAESLALRSLRAQYRSVIEYCNYKGLLVPSQVKKIGKWLTSTGNFGFNLGITILGFGGNVGRNVVLPKLDDVTFEDITDAVACISSEVVSNLGFAGSIIAIDNVENYESDVLGKILICFRDSLFSTKNVWWVLIGQSGLGSLIKTLDTRVSERMAGSGIEIKPISIDELHDAVDLRVDRFHSTQAGRAPLSRNIHETLFNASFGETRYVFDYANAICIQFVEDARALVIKDLKAEYGSSFTRNHVEKRLDTALGNMLAEKSIPDESAIAILQAIIERELNGLALENKEISVLRKIGDLDGVQPNNYKQFSVTSKREFSKNYLLKMWKQKLLIREQQEKIYRYRLRGLAKSAYDFGLLD